MDLFTALLKSTNNDWGVIFLANLTICLIGFAWIVGAKNIATSKARWLTFLFFWFGLSVFYFLKLFAVPAAEFPFYFLDLSLAALLIGAALEIGLNKKQKYILILTAIIVLAVARIFDNYNITNINNLDYGNQLITTFGILIWAWIHRLENITQSLVIVVYGLMQMPFLQIVDLFHIHSSLSTDDFVSATYVAYFIGKFALIAACYSVISSGKNA